MGEGFYFVDGLTPDRASTRMKRRHVMKGKNAGKSVRRHRRGDISGPASAGAIVLARKGKSPMTSPTAPLKYLGSEILSLPTPVPFTPYSVEVLNQCP